MFFFTMKAFKYIDKTTRLKKTLHLRYLAKLNIGKN